MINVSRCFNLFLDATLKKCVGISMDLSTVQLPNHPKSQRSGQLPVPPGPSWASFCSCRLGVEPAVAALLGRNGSSGAKVEWCSTLRPSGFAALYTRQDHIVFAFKDGEGTGCG